MPVIDWLEEILKAVKQADPEETGEILMSLLKTAGAALPNRTGAVYGRHEAEEMGEDEPGGGRNFSRTAMGAAGAEHSGDSPGGLDSPLQGLYRESDRKSGLQMLYTRSSTHSALRDLYRRVSETVRHDLTPAGNRMNTVVVREEGPAAAGLTVGEFDRAVRRDSRRYDGGMSIY